MKNLIILTKILILLTLALNLQAQKVKLKDFKVRTEQVGLPTIGFNESVTTYECQVECDEDILKQYRITPSSIANLIKIGGYTKIEGGASVSVIVNVENPTSSPREMHTETKENKDKEKYKLYKYYYDLQFKATYRIVDASGNIIHENGFAKKERLSTKQYRSTKELLENYKKDYPAAKTNGINKLVLSIAADINTDVNTKFSVGKYVSTVYFAGIKSKGHPDVDKFKKIRMTVEEAFNKMKVDNNQEFLTAIEPAVQFWIEKESSFSTSDKQEKKLNYACRRNAAIAYYWMEDFENALKYANMIVEGGYNAKKGKKIIGYIKETQERMKKLNFTTRHFAVNVSKEDKANLDAFNTEQEEIYESGDIRRFPKFDKVMNVKTESTVARGKMFLKNGSVNEGYYVYELANGVPPFWKPRSIRFGMEENRLIKTGTPKYSILDSMLIGSKMYRVKPVKLGSLKLKNGIVEVVESFERTRLEIIHPPFEKGKGIAGTEVELESSYVIWNIKKKKHFSPDGLSFYKSMKKTVGDCPASMEYLDKMKKEHKKKKLVTKLLSSSYDTKNLIEVLKLYDTCN